MKTQNVYKEISHVCTLHCLHRYWRFLFNNLKGSQLYCISENGQKDS